MHAISLSHDFQRPLWLGLEPGAVLQSAACGLLRLERSAGPPSSTLWQLIDFAQGRLMKDLTAQQVITASSLMAGALQAALIQSLIRKKVISDEEGHEIYEHALLMLEASQAVCSSPDVFEAARELIEQHLRTP